MDPPIKIAHGEWVVVCDGRKALILENGGDRSFPILLTKEVHEHVESRTNELGSDSPGRVHPSIGTARSALEQTDWHDESERAFLETLAHRLDKAVSTDEVKALTVVASPRALGMIRAFYSPGVRKAVRTEIGKDLVKLPIHVIEKHLLD